MTHLIKTDEIGFQMNKLPNNFLLINCTIVCSIRKGLLRFQETFYSKQSIVINNNSVKTYQTTIIYWITQTQTGECLFTARPIFKCSTMHLQRSIVFALLRGPIRFALLQRATSTSSPTSRCFLMKLLWSQSIVTHNERH